MYAIIDKRTPEKSINNLLKYVDEVFLFETEGITYESISCHPDIFIYPYIEKLIIAKNSPQKLVQFLNRKNINFEFGENSVGSKLQDTTQYNCVSSENYFIHNLKYTDEKILNLNKNKVHINVNQAYTACSLLHLKNDVFVTSDLGIFKTLKSEKIEVYYFFPEEIKIFGHKNGFFGGTCGIIDNQLFFNGNVDFHRDGKELRNLAEKLEIEVINLSDIFLYDGGKIIFCK